jgi:hypothetical protein
MSTKGIIDRVLPWCPGWERQSGKKNLLKVLEQGLDDLFSWNHESMIYRGVDNQGFPPYLTTVSGTYDYSVVAANLSCGAITRNIGGTEYTFVARLVDKISVDVTSESYDESPWITMPYLLESSPYAISNTRRWFVDYRVSTQPAYENTAPTVKFQDDPGSSTDKFFIRFFIGPPRLTSDSIQAPIPYGMERDMEEYIIGFTKWRETDKWNDRMQYFEDVTKEKFHSIMGSCANASSTRISPQYF